MKNVAFDIFNFGIFHKFLSTQNVNVARFARNVEWDFFCDFQTLWIYLMFFIAVPRTSTFPIPIFDAIF